MTDKDKDKVTFRVATTPDLPDSVVSLSRNAAPSEENPLIDATRPEWEQELIEEERDRLHNLPLGTHTRARVIEQRVRQEEAIRAKVRRELEGPKYYGPDPSEVAPLPPDAKPFSTAPGPTRPLDPRSIDPYGISPTKPVEE
jgi:hypothetical protein